MARSTNTRFAVAVHVLTYLAGVLEGRTVSSEELSESTHVNAAHIRRVLGPLRGAGVVRSRPGVHGGWQLAVDAAEIGLDRVWLLLQGADPVLGLHEPAPTCVVGRAVQKTLDTLDRTVAGAVATELGHFTVRDVLNGLPAPASGPHGS
ncbi:Rrf2 family protein [Streptomyces sp. V3I8]|uniref:Rrf2 family transcriptional regulator n=1 Tax=Streptomyces sp. V3I8 TaxID=3042279 RepID=UPI0027815453|nr:Rrf2 family transcriptional regulator [Streptomyces sp. V3I8]MDQ1033849.1 Rrf2 family protein [Streptomyces sp. V3I8]